MTTNQANHLLPNTVVMRNQNPVDLGTVRLIGPDCVYIDWENGEGTGWIKFGDLKNVSVY